MTLKLALLLTSPVVVAVILVAWAVTITTARLAPTLHMLQGAGVLR